MFHSLINYKLISKNIIYIHFCLLKTAYCLHKHPNFRRRLSCSPHCHSTTVPRMTDRIPWCPLYVLGHCYLLWRVYARLPQITVLLMGFMTIIRWLWSHTRIGVGQILHVIVLKSQITLLFIYLLNYFWTEFSRDFNTNAF